MSNYILVKIKDEDPYMGQTDLEYYAKDVALLLAPSPLFESTHVVLYNGGSGHYVRPSWAETHQVNK